MARLARSTVIGVPHQVTQRGNYDQKVFEEEHDFRRYLGWLKEYTDRYQVEIWAYCLMPNHVHFVCVPKLEGGLARIFNTLHMKYAQHCHGRKGVNGHLWRARFLSCMLDEASVLEEVRHIENNPVRAGIVAHAQDYKWSSARHHVLGEADPVVEDGCFLRGRIENWKEYLGGDGDEPVLRRNWQCLKTGRPAGDPEWVHKLEAIVGRRLQALPRGRPRKNPVSVRAPLNEKKPVG